VTTASWARARRTRGSGWGDSNSGPSPERVPGGSCAGCLTCRFLAAVGPARARCSPLSAGTACTHRVPAGSARPLAEDQSDGGDRDRTGPTGRRARQRPCTRQVDSRLPGCGLLRVVGRSAWRLLSLASLASSRDHRVVGRRARPLLSFTSEGPGAEATTCGFAYRERHSNSKTQ
jgi:hypothetical protein